MTLNKDWCLAEYTGPQVNKFSYTSQNELYATDQILINGHYLYGKNVEFRKVYLDTFKCELQLPKTELVNFLYKNNFNLMYFGLLAAPYIINAGSTPQFYLEHCSPARSTLLSQFISSETLRLHHPVNPKPGMPGYYYKESRTKSFKSYDPRDNGRIVSFCPIKNILEIAIDYAKKLNDDAKSFVNANSTDENVKNFLNVLRDESWSPLLYGK